jgi:hypothetical protein
MLQLKTPEGVEDFESYVIDCYALMFPSEEIGAAWFDKETVNGFCQAAYTELVKSRHHISDWLSHEVVTIMNDLGVVVNDDDPLLEKKYFVFEHSREDEPPTYLRNPYYKGTKGFYPTQAINWLKGWLSNPYGIVQAFKDTDMVLFNDVETSPPPYLAKKLGETWLNLVVNPDKQLKAVSNERKARIEMVGGV